MRGAAVPQSLPLARSNAEARVFLRLQPCHVCGSKDCAFDSAVLRVDGELVGRYRGGCAVCGAEREYLFRIPEQVLVPPADGVRFGDERPSQLLDPGVWLWYSDRCATLALEPGAALDEVETAAHRVLPRSKVLRVTHSDAGQALVVASEPMRDVSLSQLAERLRTIPGVRGVELSR